MLSAIRTYLRYTSWPIIAAMVALIVIGVLAIELAEDSHGGEMQGFAAKQAQFAVVALAAFVVVTLIPYPKLGRYAYVLFGGCMFLLVLVLFLPATRDTNRWINLRVFQLQPSELAKFGYVILLAWYLRYGSHYRSLRGLVVPFLLTLAPMGLILVEPDLGTSLLFLPTLYIVLYVAGAKLRHLLGIVAVATVLMLVPIPREISPGMSAREAEARKRLAYWCGEWNGRTYAVSAAPLAKMKYHQVRRIYGWLWQHDQRVRNDEGFQLYYGKLVLASGRATGRGLGDDTDLYFRILPEDHTDFIFSIVGGQWGFAGAAAVLVLYGVIFLFGVEISTVTYDPFGRLLAVGVLAVLFTQLVINLGMTMGLLPITGMTLPLVSYGGSSLVVNCMMLGLLVNVGQRRPILLGQRPFEHGDRKDKPPTPYSPVAEGSRGRQAVLPGKSQRV